MKYQPHIDTVIGIARAEGCVVVVKDVQELDGCGGLFYPHRKRPRIEIAAMCPEKKSIFYVLVHELMHYRQYKSSVPDALKNLRSTSLNRVLMCEYEAEKMSAWFLIEYGLPAFNLERHVESANRYMQVIKWEHANRDKKIECPRLIKSVSVPSTWWTDVELIEPLSEIDKIAFGRYYKRYGVK